MTAPHRRRVARHRSVSAALGRLGDDELAERVTSARVIGAGIGGDVARLDVAGAAVFVKRIPLTDLERQPGKAWTVDEWLRRRLAAGPQALASAVRMVGRALARAGAAQRLHQGLRRRR